MANATLDYIYEQYKILDKKIADAEEIIQFSLSAGVDVSKAQARLRTSKNKLEGYKNALKGKGYAV